MDTHKTIKYLYGGGGIPIDLPPRTTSGLVEQQRWFDLLRRKLSAEELAFSNRAHTAEFPRGASMALLFHRRPRGHPVGGAAPDPGCRGNAVLRVRRRAPIREELVQAGYRMRIAGDLEFGIRSRVLLIQDPVGVPIDVALGALPFEDEMMDRSSLFEFRPVSSCAPAPPKI